MPGVDDDPTILQFIASLSPARPQEYTPREEVVPTSMTTPSWPPPHVRLPMSPSASPRARDGGGDRKASRLLRGRHELHAGSLPHPSAAKARRVRLRVRPLHAALARVLAGSAVAPRVSATAAGTGAGGEPPRAKASAGAKAADAAIGGGGEPGVAFADRAVAAKIYELAAQSCARAMCTVCRSGVGRSCGLVVPRTTRRAPSIHVPTISWTTRSSTRSMTARRRHPPTPRRQNDHHPLQPSHLQQKSQQLLPHNRHHRRQKIKQPTTPRSSSSNRRARRASTRWRCRPARRSSRL